jgi:hypothetical protein
MIYPTVKECIDDCSKTGVLKVAGLKNEEYILKGAGFTPRYSRDLERTQGSKTLTKSVCLETPAKASDFRSVILKTPSKAVAFFSLIPIIILL